LHFRWWSGAVERAARENRLKTEQHCSGPEVQYAKSMIAQSEIRQMSFPEKVALLETVWSEIAADPGQVEVPQWHKDILDERDLALNEGRATVLEWDEAKRQIERATR
jgi:putative addiction module component (TIGR02574 family)